MSASYTLSYKLLPDLNSRSLMLSQFSSMQPLAGFILGLRAAFIWWSFSFRRIVAKIVNGICELQQRHGTYRAEATTQGLTFRTFLGFTNSNFAEQIINCTIRQDFRAMNDCLHDLDLSGEDDAGEITVRKDRWNGVQTGGGFVDATSRRKELNSQWTRDIRNTLIFFVARDTMSADQDSLARLSP